MTMIPYGHQDISQADIDAVVDVLRSDFLTQGPVVSAFESAVAGYCGVRYAVATNSATSALHIACLALGVGKNDWVWTSPITFVASANCALHCGAMIDFVDIDPRTYNMSVERLAEKLAVAERCGVLPKVVIPVHMCGQSCDMSEIYALSQYYGFKIIEDASHAIGGKYHNSPIGNCVYSDITIFSFHPVKNITTGEGGMALTNSPELAQRMVLLHSHGITRDPAEMTRTPDGPWYYEQIELGFNYRMSDIQAALGMSQMARLDEFVRRRHEIASRYDDALRDLPVATPWLSLDTYSAYHLYIIRIQCERIRKPYSDIFGELRQNGVGVNLHYIPVHTQPYFQRMGFKIGDFPESERYYTEAISLPIFPALNSTDQEKVISVLERALTVKFR